MKSSELSKELKMLDATLSSLPPTLIYQGLASAIFSILGEKGENINRVESNVDTICGVIGSVTALLGDSYDGYTFIDALLNCSQSVGQKVDFYVMSRIIFECVTAMVPNATVQSRLMMQSLRGTSQRNVISDQTYMDLKNLESFSSKLLKVKKEILRWCLGTNMNVKEVAERDRKRGTKLKLNKPDFGSILDGDTEATDSSHESALIKTLTNLIFLDNSNQLSETESDEKLFRIKMCAEYGCDVDNDILQIITNSVTTGEGPLDAPDAIALIELIFKCCGRNKRSSFLVDDCNVIWDLYKLTEYKPDLSQIKSELEIPK